MRAGLLICAILISANVCAERYLVTEDGFGNFSAERAEDQESIPVDTAVPDSLVPSTKKAPPSQSTKHEIGEQLDTESKQIQVVEKGRVSLVSENKQAETKKISVFERVYLETERKAKENALNELKKKGVEGTDYDATKVNQVDFVDGDDLARTGGREEVEKAPYFITVDANGNLQNTFYDPVLVGEALDKQRNKKIEYTQARVYERSVLEEDGLALPEGADAIAAQILKSGNKELELYFDTFSKRCCSMLPNILVPKLEMGRSKAFKISDDDLYYRFSEGDSRYLLVALPAESHTNYPLRIRTFIRTFKKKSIEHGVFFPQIVTLDAEKNPLRIMSGPLLKYIEETWTTHGYLEGVFEIDRSENKDEHYLLINTTKPVLRQTSTIETEDPVEIIHMSVGSFELEAILEI